MNASQFPGQTLAPIPANGGYVGDDEFSNVQKINQLLFNIVAAGGGGGGGSGITQLTGDVTAGPGSGSVVATLATVNSNVGSFTNANITVDAKGRITTAANGSSVTVPGTATQVLTSDGAGGITATGVMINGSNNLLWPTDGGGDIGANGANRPASGYFSSKVSATTLEMDAGQGIHFASSGYIRMSNGIFRFANNSDSGGAPLGISDAATNTIVTALTLTHATSGTAAAGLGVGQVFQLPSSTGVNRIAGNIECFWGDPTNTLENSELDISVLSGGAKAIIAAFLPSGMNVNGKMFASTFVQGKLQTAANATTGLIAGALAALTNASVVIYDATGTAYRVPCVTP